MRVTEIPKLRQLSKPEKILLVEDLWDNIAADDSDIPVPKSHKDELNRRLARHAKTPGNLLSLRQLQERIQKWK
jgi:putative addiction module component (TIGR02574 family)